MSKLTKLLAQIEERAEKAVGGTYAMTEITETTTPRLLKALEKAIEQRDRYANWVEMHTDRDDAELAAILEGKDQP